MGSLVNTMALRQNRSGSGAVLSRASSGGPANPRFGDRPGSNGPGVSEWPIFNVGGNDLGIPNGPAQNWDVRDSQGRPVPYNEWPNQNNNYTSPDEITRRNEQRRAAEEAIARYQSSLNSGIAGINDIRAQVMRNQAAANAGYANTEAAYRNQLQGQLAEANLDIRATDIQLGNMPQWQSFLAQQWGNRMTTGKQELDYLGNQQINNLRQRMIEWQGIQQGRKEVGQQAQRATRDATSAATVSGVIQGAKQDFADIDQERANALYDLDLQDKQSKLNETQRRQEIANRRDQLIGDLKSYDISTREQQAKLREREQLLGIEAERARLRPRQLMDAMNVTLARLGLDRVMSTGQFLESMANMNAQERSLIDQFLQNTYQGG